MVLLSQWTGISLFLYAPQVRAVVQQIINEGCKEAARVNYNKMPLLWAWHGQYYLGGTLDIGRVGSQQEVSIESQHVLT